MIELKIIAVGTGLGLELPLEMLEQLDANLGECIYLEHMCNASYRLAKHDEKFVEQMILIDGQMHEEDS
jgi:hypothetical protein